MTRSKAVSKMLITICFGMFGVHKFMDHKTKMGFLYLFTMGLFCFGWIYDSFMSIINCVKVFCQYSALQKSSNVSSNHIAYHNPAEPVYDFDQPYDNMDGHTFEYFCADLLSKNGFTDVEVTKGSGDQGIDVIAYKDGMKYGIQCKCYSSDIGNKAVQEAFAGKTYYNCHVAAVLTNRHFTKSAKELSYSNKVLLWDREKLEELIENA